MRAIPFNEIPCTKYKAGQATPKCRVEITLDAKELQRFVCYKKILVYIYCALYAYRHNLPDDALSIFL